MLLFGSGRLLSVQVSAGDADAECWSLADRGTAEAIGAPQSVHKYEPVDVDADETEDALPTIAVPVPMPQPDPFFGAQLSGGRNSSLSKGGPELPPPELLAARLHDTSPLLYTSSLAALEAKARENVWRAKADEQQRSQALAQAEAEAAAVTTFLESKHATPRGSQSNTLSRTGQNLKTTVLWDGTRTSTGGNPSNTTVLWDGTRVSIGGNPSTTATSGALIGSGTASMNRARPSGPTWIGTSGGASALGGLPTYPTPSTLASPPPLMAARPVGTMAGNGTNIVEESLDNAVPPNLSFVLYARAQAPEGGDALVTQSPVEPVGESVVGGKESTTVVYGTNGNNGLENAGPDSGGNPKLLTGNLESSRSPNVHYYRAFKNPPFKYS